MLADRRSNRGWVTVKRDDQGLRHDVDIFQYLLDTNAGETEMHRFFEQHPAFLMEALLGMPLSPHRPVFAYILRVICRIIPLLADAQSGYKAASLISWN